MPQAHVRKGAKIGVTCVSLSAQAASSSRAGVQRAYMREKRGMGWKSLCVGGTIVSGCGAEPLHMRLADVMCQEHQGGPPSTRTRRKCHVVEEGGDALRTHPTSDVCVVGRRVRCRCEGREGANS